MLRFSDLVYRARSRTSLRSETGVLRFTVVVAVFLGICLSGCSAGNFRWYSPHDTKQQTTIASRYTGESVYADKFLLRKQLSVDDPLLIEIDGKIRIHASDLLTRLEDSYLLANGGTLSWEQAADTLEILLIDTLVSLAADTFHLHQDSASWGDFSTVRDALLSRMFIAEVIYPQAKVDSLEVDSFYYSRPDIFTYYGQVNIGHIVLSKDGYRIGPDSAYYAEMSDDELDSLIYLRLRYLKDVITDSLVFQQLAEEYSHDRRTGVRGGRLGWVERYNLHPEIEDVLYDENTPLRRVIGPLKSRDGVHLFYIYDRHFKGVPPLNEQRYRQAYGYVLGALAKEIYGRVRDSLRVEHPTTFDDSVLALSSGQADAETPVAWASGIDTVRFITYDRARVMFRMKIPYDKILPLEQLRSLAQGEVDKRLSLLMARQLGIANNPEYKAEEEREYHNFAKAAIHRDSKDLNYKPDDKEIRRYFQDHQPEYVVDKPVRIQQIVFEDSLQAEFVRALAESGEDFLELAATYYPGDSAIRRDVADLGYIGPDDFDRNIFSVAQRGSPGAVTPPIKTLYGYHIVKIIDVKREVTLEDVRGAIVQRLARLHDEHVRRLWRKSLQNGHVVRIEPVRYRGVVMGRDEDRSFLPRDILPEGLKDSQL